MAFNQQDIERASAMIHAAAFDPAAWPAALEQIRGAGGGWSGQLAGIYPGRGLAFDFCDGVPEEIRQEFERLGGPDPSVNPLARVFLRPPGGRVITDEDLFGLEERRTNAFYNDFLLPNGSRHLSMVRVRAPGDLRVIMGVIRSPQQGPASIEHQRALMALAGPVQAALRIQHTLDAHGARLALGGFDALAAAAFVCDYWGRVLEATEAGDAELAAGAFLRVRRGRLEAVDRASDEDLQAALRAAVSPRPVTSAGLQDRVLLNQRTGPPTIADVARLPTHAHSLRTGSATIVILRRRGSSDADTFLLRRVFRLTEAEAAVAMSLFAGASASQIAEARATALHTVRTQMKIIFDKVGVSSQLALARAIGDLLEGRTVS